MSFEWSSLLPFIEKLIPKGKVYLNQRRFVIHYESEGLSNEIRSFSLHLQFINSTKNPIIITDLKAKFYDGEEFIDLFFIPTSLIPVINLEASKSSDFKFDLSLPHPNGMSLPILAITNDIAHLDFRFRIKGRNYSEFIHDIILDEKNSPYTWVAL